MKLKTPTKKGRIFQMYDEKRKKIGGILGFSFLDCGADLADGGRLRLKDADGISLRETADSLVLSVKFGGLCGEFSFVRTADRRLCRGRFSGETANCRIRRIVLFEGEAPCPPKSRFLIYAPMRWGIYPPCALKETETSEDFFSLYAADEPENALSMCNELPCRFASSIAIERDGETAKFAADTVFPDSFEGEKESETWQIFSGMAYPEAFRRAAGEKKKDLPAPTGWSTWDYYFTSATEEDVARQASFLAENGEIGGKLKYIALDDGWQQREGDWLCGARYPHGLKHTADRIRACGFEAGIWVAPTRLHILSGTVMRRNDFLVRDEYGDPVTDEDMYVLDPTHPDGEAFLRETFTRLASYGFTFYKLDFLANLLYSARRFYDRQAGPYDALRRLIDIVRECVPEGSHIMGCNLPYGTGGFVDSRRTGVDIHNTWKHIKACLACLLPVCAANGVIYRNDIDYLVVRGKDTSDDPFLNVLNPSAGKYAAAPSAAFRWRDGADFSYREAKCWCAAVLMSGSSIFLGDRADKLNAAGLDLVKRTLAAADFTPAQPTADEGELPAVWRKEKQIYIFNFTEEERAFRVVAENGKYRDVFSDIYCSATENALVIRLAAHDCAALQKV